MCCWSPVKTRTQGTTKRTLAVGGGSAKLFVAQCAETALSFFHASTPVRCQVSLETLPVNHCAVAWFAQPVMAFQEVQVCSAVVRRHRDGDFEQVLLELASAALGRGELKQGVVLALQFVLVLCQKSQVTDII